MGHVGRSSRKRERPRVPISAKTLNWLYGVWRKEYANQIGFYDFFIKALRFGVRAYERDRRV